MENAEERSSVVDYMKSMTRSVSTLRWANSLIKTGATRKWSVSMYSMLVLFISLQLIQPRIVSLVFDGVIEGNRKLAEMAILTILLADLLQRTFIYWYHVSREWLWGLRHVQLNKSITELFFEKSPGQHKSIRSLNYESVHKGKEGVFDVFQNILPDFSDVLLRGGIAMALLFTISWKIGLAMLGLIVLYLIWSLFLNWKVDIVTDPIETDFRRHRRHQAERWRGVERVTYSGKREHEVDHMTDWELNIFKKDRTFWIWFTSQAFRRAFFLICSRILIMWYGIDAVMSGSWSSVGLLYPLFAWSDIIRNQLWMVEMYERRIHSHMPKIRAMERVLVLEPEIVDSPDAEEFASEGPIDLRFKDISYSYPESDSTEILTGLSLSVEPGSKVAVVGPSGAGKSTLMYLVMRFMNPTSGNLVANGVDVAGCSQDSWLSHLAYISQHSHIFDGTVEYNLRYGLSVEENERVTREDMERLLDRLSIDFGRRPDGESALDIVVGREGLKLSGGQAQRLAIGSAALRNPKLMIVDEATSHLDTHNERRVVEGLNGMLGDVTTLVIAHRLATVKDADKIVVMNEGRIEAVGNSFEELTRISQTFRQLIKDQDLGVAV